MRNRIMAVLSVFVLLFSSNIFAQTSEPKAVDSAQVIVVPSQEDIINACYEKYRKEEDMSPSCLKVIISDQLPWLLEDVSGRTMEQIKAIKKGYPYMGIGIQWNYSREIEMPESPDSFVIFRALVKTVWIDSPADKAGVKPGDQIVWVGDYAPPSVSVRQEVLVSDEEYEKFGELLEVYKNNIRSRFKVGDSSTFTVERDGQQHFTYTLGKVLIGQDVADLIDTNMEKWEKEFRRLQEETEKLSRDLAKIKNVTEKDRKKLLKMYNNMMELNEKADAPFREVFSTEKFRS